MGNIFCSYNEDLIKKIFVGSQGGSNPWPHDYWPDALTSWAMFFSKLNNCHQAVNYSLHWTNKNRYPRSIRPFFGVVKIALYNEQFLLRIIGLCWPIFQWSRFFFPQWCTAVSVWLTGFCWSEPPANFLNFLGKIL